MNFVDEVAFAIDPLIHDEQIQEKISNLYLQNYSGLQANREIPFLPTNILSKRDINNMLRDLSGV